MAPWLKLNVNVVWQLSGWNSSCANRTHVTSTRQKTQLLTAERRHSRQEGKRCRSISDGNFNSIYSLVAESDNDRSYEQVKHRSITADASGSDHRKDESGSATSQQSDECAWTEGELFNHYATFFMFVQLPLNQKLKLTNRCFVSIAFTSSFDSTLSISLT